MKFPAVIPYIKPTLGRELAIVSSLSEMELEAANASMKMCTRAGFGLEPKLRQVS